MKSYYLIFVAIFTISCSEKKLAPKTTEHTAQIDIVKSESKKKNILFFGDSLTAGFGLEEEESFPSLIQDRIDSLGLPYQVINAGLSGETSAGGKNRIDWILSQPVHIFILELGANDVLRGLPLDQTHFNLDAILSNVTMTYPNAKIIIAGMLAPPNMGAEYSTQFKNIFSSLSEKYDASLIPFLLDGVAGEVDLNLSDGKHPNAEGQKIIRENIWQMLQPLL